jgi:hypothetical protein
LQPLPQFVFELPVTCYSMFAAPVESKRLFPESTQDELRVVE